MADRGVRRVRAALFAAFVLAACVACGRGDAPVAAASTARWLPDFAARQAGVDTLAVRAPGDRVVVRLRRDGATWRVAERDGWPADSTRVEALLDGLADARAIEPKTTRADRYPRIGVQAIADPAGDGVRLDVEGGGPPLRLLLGHAKGDRQRFVRVDGDAQAWLVDRPLRAPADPLAWLDTRLVDAPLARVAKVEVRTATGDAFVLAHREDRFRVEGLPAAATTTHAGDALGGALDALAFEDVARDDGKAPPERTVRFSGHDGGWIELQMWRIDGHVWVRASNGGGGVLAKAFAQPQATDGWRFRLPAFQAAALMASRAQILGAAP